MTTFSRLEVADYLTDEATIAEYLNAALEEGDSLALLMAIRDVMQARGITKLTESPALNLITLGEVLPSDAMPSYEDMANLLRTLGFRLAVRRM